MVLISVTKSQIISNLIIIICSKNKSHGRTMLTYLVLIGHEVSHLTEQS